ncbi:MAG: deoxyguanosinetriphosphate triphosphohydrolase [Bacillota bacterium]|nr:MAG: deoxyguanosinetriphosphate triphosphohydrolase [Bacillota bacterium]
MIRQAAEELEERVLSPFAATSRRSKGRERPEEECEVRTCFQRDRDRIIHSKAFRRLKGKTQVFLSPRGDHYRTRLTHSLEVSQVARTIARALALNEDLAEAIALGHDLGHTPFGHAGEAALDLVVPGGFRHNEQSLRVVTVLESDGQGLNLTWEVRDGILCHVPDGGPATLEGQVVQWADRIAYINHDIDDAIRAGVLAPGDLPPEVPGVLGPRGSRRIGAMVRNIIETSRDKEEVTMSGQVAEVTEYLHRFMFERVYLRQAAKAEHERVKRMVGDLYIFYTRNPGALAREYPRAGSPPSGATAENPGVAEGLGRLAADYVAGMTDRFAIDRYTDHFIPHTWEE